MRNVHPKAEVNLQDFLMLIALLSAAIVIASYLSNAFGWIGFLVGLPVGLALSFGLLYLAVLLFATLEALIKGGIPYLPTCGTGKCRSGLLTDFGDYEPERIDGEFGYFRCRCGGLYYRAQDGGRVLEVLPDGTKAPYAVWRPFRGWRREGKA